MYITDHNKMAVCILTYPMLGAISTTLGLHFAATDIVCHQGHSSVNDAVPPLNTYSHICNFSASLSVKWLA